ncbi:MAG: phage tail protein [Dermatophilaceae bacterium]
MSDQYIGEIRLFGFTYPPNGWAQCNGQLLSIQTNTALFSLLGTTYGGNGQTTFALPDLRGRVPVGSGQGPGLSPYDQGQLGGTERVTLTTGQMPMHNHVVAAASSATDKNPSGALPAFTAAGASYGTTADLTMSPTMTGQMGGNGAHPNVPPYLALNWCIALVGEYPSRG